MACNDGYDLWLVVGWLDEYWKSEGNQASVFDICVCIDKRLSASVVVFYEPFHVFDYTNYPDVIVFDGNVVQRSTEYIEPTQVAWSLHRVV